MKIIVKILLGIAIILMMCVGCKPQKQIGNNATDSTAVVVSLTDSTYLADSVFRPMLKHYFNGKTSNCSTLIADLENNALKCPVEKDLLVMSTPGATTVLYAREDNFGFDPSFELLDGSSRACTFVLKPSHLYSDRMEYMEDLMSHGGVLAYYEFVKAGDMPVYALVREGEIETHAVSIPYGEPEALALHFLNETGRMRSIYFVKTPSDKYSLFLIDDAIPGEA